MHDNGVIVFTIRSFSRLVEYYVFQGTILKVNTIDIILIEQQLVIDPGFTIMSPVIIESGATVIADTALTEEVITRHLRIISTLTGISLGYFTNNVNIVIGLKLCSKKRKSADQWHLLLCLLAYNQGILLIL